MFQFLFSTMQRESAVSFPMLGDFSIDPPAYFTVFGINIYFYGVLIGLGFILAMLYCSKRCSKFGIRQDDFFDMMLWLLPFSIIGARLYYVLFELDSYLADPAKIFAIRDGGLAIYGGVIAGILVIWLVCRRKKIPVLAMLDLVVFGLLIGQILGRWGNFMNREAFGAETEIFCRMGLTAPDGTTIFVHPTFLYESLWNLIGLIFLIVWTNKGKRRYDGQCLLIYFLWYGSGRAWIEGLRTDSLYIGGSNIRVSQALSIALALIALAVLIVQSRRPHSPEELYVNRAARAGAEEKTTTDTQTETSGGNNNG